MHIPLEGLAGEPQSEFFEHFTAGLRRMGGYTGSSGFSPEGSFQVSLNCSLPVGDSSVCLTWEWERKSDGSVDALSVAPERDECTTAGWEHAAYEFVAKAFATALQKKRTEFFSRSLYLYVGVNMDGEYWFPHTRVAPAICEDAKPYLVNCERAVYIDQVIAGIDATHAGELAAARANRIAARISLLLNVGLYPMDSDIRFVMFADGASMPLPDRLHLGYVDRRPWPAGMPSKGKECTLGSLLSPGADQQPWSNEKLKLPAETRSIFRAADDTTHLFGEAFDSCARLYQVSLVAGRHFSTVRLAYQIAAVEAITKSDRSLSGFGEFMRRYAPATDGLESLLDYLWGSVRSAHFHAGEFPLGDFVARKFDLTSPALMERDSIAYRAHWLIRQAILSWAREASAAIDPHRRKQSR